jgi:GntR family transcriptional regulator
MQDTPKYLQVISYLEHLILKQSAHHMIPSERTLSEHLLISRMTIRKAIDLLVSQGKLYRIQHKGTFISEQKLFKVYNTMSGFSDEVTSSGSSVQTDVIVFEIMASSAEIALKLNLAQGHLVYHVKRLRKKDDIPMIIEDAYMPVDLFELTKEDATHSIYQTIRKKQKVPMSSSIQEIKAILVDEETSRYLKMQVGEPTISTVYTSYLENGRIFEYVQTIKNQHHYELIVQSFHIKAGNHD